MGVSIANNDAVTEYHCPAEATPDVIGGTWKDAILFSISHDGTHRFAGLRRRIPGASERMPTRQRRELEDDSIVHQDVYPEVPPTVVYSLTEYSKTLRPITTVWCEWGQ